MAHKYHRLGGPSVPMFCTLPYLMAHTYHRFGWPSVHMRHPYGTLSTIYCVRLSEDKLRFVNLLNKCLYVIRAS